MIGPAFIALLQNVAALLAAVALFDLITRRRQLEGRTLRQALVGAFLGVLAVGLILGAFELEPGIVFDARSVLLGISGLFLGTVPTLVAMGISAVFRLMQGGVAAWTGVAVILVSGGLGIAWRKLRRKPLEDFGPGELYAFGLLVHGGMLALMMTLPWDNARRVLVAIGLPVILLFPVATMALGILLVNRLRHDRALADLADSEARYRSIFENNHASMLLIDPEAGQIVDANPAASRFYGWTRDQLRRMRIGQINVLPPEQLRHEMERARAAKNYHFRFTHRLSDATLRNVEVFSGPIAMGGRDLLYSIVHDVTERTQAECSLRQVSSLLGIASRVARFGGWSIDPAEERVVWSEEIASILELPPGFSPTLEEVIALYAPEWQQRIAEVYDACAQEGKAFDEEMVAVTARGRRLWVRVLGEAERDAAGRIVRVHGAIQDISQLRLGEATLRESEQRYRTLFEANPHCMWVYDLATLRFLAVNDTAAERYGYSREEFLGMTLKDIRPAEEVPRLLENVAACSGVLQESGVWRHRKKSGEIMLVDIASHALTWEGRSARLVLVHDVTAREEARRALEASRQALLSVVEDQREAEAEVRRLNEALEGRVRERTAQLEAANRDLEAFSYSVSHDLRAPLRAINGYARILIEDHGERLGPEGLRVSGVVRDEAVRMGQLIDDLLHFSRLGRQALQLAPTDMTTLAREVFEKLKGGVPDREVVFRLSELPAVLTDQTLLRQVWYNLLDNALKYTRRRARTEIAVSGVVQGGEAIYRVRDNGAGFDMKYLHQLFRVFRRLHGTDDFEGTGVGLALVRRIVHRHGGRVWAEATVDDGATFFFALPVAGKPLSGDTNVGQSTLPYDANNA
ncbi:MAG: PAS domain S-box protein [Verrucomicrobia bacterium]|nr:PAS domain S-box protein [Verrucomicrobiota bacterium]